MCLAVSKRHRNLFTGKYKPKKLRKDLTVYKILISEKDMKDCAHTPFFGMSVRFKGGYFTPPTIDYEDFKMLEDSVVDNECIGKTKGMYAYHAYLNRDDAIKTMFYYYTTTTSERFRTYDENMKETIQHQLPYLYECVIPAGSYVYYGAHSSSNQIATNAITIIQKPRIRVVRGNDNALSCAFDEPQKYR